MRIIIFGGGTGLSNILTGFKNDVGKLIEKLTAVVTVTDSGGSSGILRKIYDIPAVGDLRNCLLALSRIENYTRKVMQFRFSKESPIKGHPLGNLFLLALLENEGNILKAVKKASKILNVIGEVFPSTFDNVKLIAEFDDGKIIEDEDQITSYGIFSKSKIKNLKIFPSNPKVPKELIERINRADIIIFSPGSLYTSILPNVLIPSIRDNINKSKALKIFVVNLLTQPGETDNFSAYDHLKEFLRISMLDKIDVVILNSGKPNKKQQKKIRKEGKKIVFNDIENFKRNGFKFYLYNLINKNDEKYIKHHPKKLRNLIIKIAKDYDII